METAKSTVQFLIILPCVVTFLVFLKAMTYECLKDVHFTFRVKMPYAKPTIVSMNRPAFAV